MYITFCLACSVLFCFYFPSHRTSLPFGWYQILVGDSNTCVVTWQCGIELVTSGLVSALTDEKLIKKQTYTKTEACKLYSRLFWIFLPNVIKINPYNFELYCFKVCAYFETQCILCVLFETLRQRPVCSTVQCVKQSSVKLTVRGSNSREETFQLMSLRSSLTMNAQTWSVLCFILLLVKHWHFKNHHESKSIQTVKTMTGKDGKAPNGALTTILINAVR